MSAALKYDWSVYKKRRIQFVLGLVATFFLMFSLGEVKSVTSFPGPVIWIAWLVLVVFPLAFRFALTPCPRCGKALHFKKGFGYPFSPACLNCGLKINSENQPEIK